MNRIVLPGATIGVLGSGQLGRMLALEARRMGYRVHTLSPGVDTPTGQVADLEVSAEYDDIEAIRTFARGVDVMSARNARGAGSAGIRYAHESLPARLADLVVWCAVRIAHRL